MADSEIPYPFLEDEGERLWLVKVEPTFVRDNAHRIYEVMTEAGIGAESFIRELAFQKAAEALGLDYDILYAAWLTGKPVPAIFRDEPFDPYVETIRLFGWSEWADCNRTVRALLFGEMVKRAKPIVEDHLSDLFHDVDWLTHHVNGPTEFWFMVRRYGTNIGDSALIQERIESSQSRVLYHVALTEDRGEWSATFSEMVRVNA